MIYPLSFEKKLGFDKIRIHLHQLCLCAIGMERVDAMTFSSDFENIDSSLRKVNEFKDICLSSTTFPVDNYNNLIPVLEKLKIIGSFPELHEAFNMMTSLETIQNIIRFFTLSEKKGYPLLTHMAQAVAYDSSVKESLNAILNEQGEVRDNASVKLMEIRREIHSKQGDVSRRINRIMRDAQTQGWVDNELSLSVRDGRLVIPVLAMYKRKIRGIIHDESASGKTVFVEPDEIVELNNDIRELEHAERREIVVILCNFADTLRPMIDVVMAWYEFLGTIDFIRAKALFAIKVEAYLPSLMNKPLMQWYDASHPLLYMYLKSEGKKIVPLNITLDQKNRILLISGPNAGGKSVCLQTVGLLQYMMQCGMLVPLKPTSEMGIFKSLFIDIGDEQSIENDLSTYSSKLLNMKHFLKHSDNETLILIDEFGSGTEPMIGGAIAESILDALNKKYCYGVITTHYTNLKHYAMSAEGVANGAMLYDTAQLRPLFVLQTGEPGSSFAFEIAKKIGLPDDILKEAEKKAGEDHIAFDRNLREILRDKHYWERKRESIKDNDKKLSEIVERYERDLSEIKAQRKDILSKARKEAEDILATANKQIENTIHEIKKAQAEKGKTQEARKKLEVQKEIIKQSDTSQQEWIERKMQQIQQRKERKANRQEEKPIEISIKKIKKPIHVGDRVSFIDQPDVIGQVLSINGDEAFIAVGHMQMHTSLTKIERTGSVSNSAPDVLKPIVRINTDLSTRKLNFVPRIDIRGMRGDEAMKEITAFIDEALMVGSSSVTILHGKGDGILRSLIRSYLKSIKEIESFADAPVDMGGAGITEVKFN